MGSYDYGKDEVYRWIKKTFPLDASILDVGAGDGKWRYPLRKYLAMDAVEIYEPHMRWLTGYRKAYCADIRYLKYDWYDLIIFGDVIEHLNVPDAQAVLEYAKPRCRDMIVAVPWMYPQDAIYGNPYEIHIQDDLTPERFAARYPGLEVLIDPGHDYCYYHKEGAT